MTAKRKPGREPVPPLEWLSAALGLLLALGIVGALVREGLAGSDHAVPVLAVKTSRVVAAGGGYVVEVTVANAAPHTAASVQIEGQLETPGAEPETSNATIDYVPGRSSAKAGLLFATDPRAGELKLRVMGYEVP